MKQEHLRVLQQASATALPLIKNGFDATATWVTRLSWWKFFLFAGVMLIAGDIIQQSLFTPDIEKVVIVNDAKKNHPRQHGQTSIIIDDAGIHINSPGEAKDKKNSAPETADKEAAANPPAPPIPTSPGAASVAAPKLVQVMPNNGGISISLPAELGQKVSDAIEEAVDDAAEQKVSHYRQESSQWFKSFIVLLVLGLFATKALMGGKKRAEVLASIANTKAEREALQRQVSEAKMQMMQAQVEPHFLFNTLASVEFLIETDPPRAAKMQQSLIKYLRAVLPQMRDSAAITNLGREADIVRAYLDLLKMRMEERLNIDFQIPDGLRSADFPPMMLQTLVENAIKHGLECKTEGGTLKVFAEVADNKLKVTVSDDGMGFGVVKSNGTGLGLPNIRERLNLLHGDQAQLRIAANQPSGVVATIEVPYQIAK